MPRKRGPVIRSRIKDAKAYEAILRVRILNPLLGSATQFLRTGGTIETLKAHMLRTPTGVDKAVDEMHRYFGGLFSRHKAKFQKSFSAAAIMTSFFPVTTEIGYPLAIALPKTEMSGYTP